MNACAHCRTISGGELEVGFSLPTETGDGFVVVGYRRFVCSVVCAAEVLRAFAGDMRRYYDTASAQPKNGPAHVESFDEEPLP